MPFIADTFNDQEPNKEPKVKGRTFDYPVEGHHRYVGPGITPLRGREAFTAECRHPMRGTSCVLGTDDRTIADCAAKFGNLRPFRGAPYVPPPAPISEQPIKVVQHIDVTFGRTNADGSVSLKPLFGGRRPIRVPVAK